MTDDPAVASLVTRASGGEEQAWDALVERYAPLIWSICRAYGLASADAEDAGRPSGCSWCASRTSSGIRPRCHDDWPPPPGGNSPEPSAP